MISKEDHYAMGREDGARQAANVVQACAELCVEDNKTMTAEELRELAQAILDNAQVGLVEDA